MTNSEEMRDAACILIITSAFTSVMCNFHIKYELSKTFQF